MPPPHPNELSVGREQAPDVARGLAVLTMVWVHFVPEPVAGPVDGLRSILWASVVGLDGLPAAMFLILVGVSWEISASRLRVEMVRRALSLLVIGLVFWRWVWSNDILMPIAMMWLLLGALRRGGRRSAMVVFVVTLACVPAAGSWWGDYAWSDVRADGTHEANHGFGWVTLRYFLFDGAYPLLPWVCFPIFGTWLATARQNGSLLLRYIAASAAVLVIGVWVACVWGDAEVGGVAAHFAITWQPTSLPFVAVWGGAAVLIIAALMRWLHVARLPRLLLPLALIGRASLSHYLLHIVVLYGALRIWWPAEDWPAIVGVAAALGYCAFAWCTTPWLLRRYRHGPVEALLRTFAGRAPSR